MYLEDSSGGFLSSRPEWSLDTRTLTWPDGRCCCIEQPSPFHWAGGTWEVLVFVSRRDGNGNGHRQLPYRALVRVEPATLRRWKEVGIDPCVEACAQLREHMRRAVSGELSLLTLL